MKNLRLCILVVATLSSNRLAADPLRMLRLGDVLRMAQSYSPDLRGGRAREVQAQADHDIVKSKIYPQVELDGIEGYGFPGSSSGLLEFGGVAGSPYRSGQAIDLTTKIKLFDLELHEEMRESANNLRAAGERTKILRAQVYAKAFGAYVQASVDRGEEEAWRDIRARVHEVNVVVRKFVKTGQHSPVELLLVQDQGDQAELNERVYHEKYQLQLKRLALLTGLNARQLECPNVKTVQETDLAAIRGVKNNPRIVEAEARLEAARSAVSKSRAERLPKFYGVGSVGTMQNARLVPEQDWSAGVALRLPIFEGFRISSKVDRAKAVTDERASELQSLHILLDEENAKFDETIASSRVELQKLEASRKAAADALKIAKRRYHNYTGRLVDVREALRNMARIETQMIAVKGELILALGQKALVNGGYVD